MNLCWNEVIPSVFQKLCIISCVSKSLCSPLHTTVEEGWDGGRVDVPYQNLREPNFEAAGSQILKGMREGFGICATSKFKMLIDFTLEHLLYHQKMSWGFPFIKIFLTRLCAPGCLESGSGARLETASKGDPMQIVLLDHIQSQRKIDLEWMFDAKLYIQLHPRLNMDL
jgi:hypothetical protein